MPMRLRYILAVAAAGLILAGRPVPAHHAFAAEFDINKPVTLEGTLKDWEMINPHSWFHIDVENKDGEIETWMIEGGSPNQLIRMGVTKRSVPIGTRLVVQGYLSRDGSNRAVGRNFTFPDGRRLFLGGSAPGAGGRNP
jgi:hypothetical protein